MASQTGLLNVWIAHCYCNCTVQPLVPAQPSHYWNLFNNVTETKVVSCSTKVGRRFHCRSTLRVEFPGHSYSVRRCGGGFSWHYNVENMIHFIWEVSFVQGCIAARNIMLDSEGRFSQLFSCLRNSVAILSSQSRPYPLWSEVLHQVVCP